MVAVTQNALRVVGADQVNDVLREVANEAAQQGRSAGGTPLADLVTAVDDRAR